MDRTNSTVEERPSLTLSRRIRAAPAKVYAAWTQAELMTQWWAPGAPKPAKVALDVRPGGRFDIRMPAADGAEHRVLGTYREVVPDARLVFTWAWISTPERESVVTVTFAPDGDGTLMTLRHDRFFDVEARDNHEKGWAPALDKLAAMLA